MGRKRKPAALAEFQGYPGGSKQEKRAALEPKPDLLVAGTPPPPYLSSVAAETWAVLGQRLNALNLLTEIDQIAFARYCDLIEKWLQVKKVLDEQSCTYQRIPKSAASAKDLSKKQKRESAHNVIRPEFYAYLQLSKELGRIEREFGLTPSARASLSVKPSGGDDGDLESDLFG